ncbi:small ribosomal subunit protein uS15m [Neocloeon triangulifer]|uniref:small ribosomal subunit protein uS15m n=1 Tax=Neocloeon triangulifer TaxID=2078957 RepID=UPI00286F88C7|nr:small ribosomal subunit protein uS15m [Neocloeon triangulifer]
MSGSILRLVRPLCEASAGLGQCRRSLKTVHIEWKRPEKPGCTHPKVSGDLSPLPKIDGEEVFREYAEAGVNLQDMSPEQRKLYTLKFLPAVYQNRTQLQRMLEKVQRHKLDNNSIEAKIALSTARIRRFQQLQETDPRNKRRKVILKEMIDRRRGYLDDLREIDYKRFEWLIEKLEIEYRPKPEDNSRITRKNSIRKLTEEYCEKVREEKLDELKNKLQREREKFEVEKKQILEWIEKEEAACEKLRQLNLQ